MAPLNVTPHPFDVTGEWTTPADALQGRPALTLDRLTYRIDRLP